MSTSETPLTSSVGAPAAAEAYTDEIACRDPWFDQLPQPALRIDSLGQITGFNAALRALCGIDKSTVPKRMSDAVTTLGLRDAQGAPLALEATPLWQALHAPSSGAVRLRLGRDLRRDGVDVEVRAERVHDSAAALLGAQLVFYPVDAKLRDATGLHDDEPDLRSLMRHTPGFFFRALDRPGYPLLYVSDAVETLTGRPAVAFVTGSLAFFDVVVPEDHAAVQRMITEQARVGLQVRVDYRIRHVDGSVRWMHSACGRVERPDGVCVLEGVSVDITPQKQAEAAAAAAHARLAALFQQSAQLQAQLSADGRILDLNDHALRVCGWPRQASVGMAFWDAPWWAGLPLESARIRDAIEAAMRGQSVRLECAYHVRDADGVSERQCDVSVVPVLDSASEVLNICVTGVDITDAARARANLADSESRLRMLMANSPGVVFRCELGTACRIEFVSDGIERLSGYTAQTLMTGQRTWMSLVHPEDRAQMESQIRTQSAQGDLVHVRYRVIHRDGRVIWCDVHAHRVEGSIFEGVVIDVSARTRVEQALAVSEARYRSIFDVSPLMLWRARPDGVLDDFNKAGLAFLGVTGEQLQADGWLGYVHPDDAPWLIEKWKHCIATGTPLSVEFRKRRHDGAYRWMQTRALAQRDADGRISSWIGANADIDEIKRAHEAAEAATHAKSQFLANMSHEIRTPMNGVIGMASLLAETSLDEVQREYVNTIRTSGEHLLALINDILDFSKAEAGRLEIESYAFDVRTCVEEAMELVALSAMQKQLDLTLETDPDVPERITGDAGRLRQVLVNLLANAIKFTEHGHIKVSLGVDCAADGDAPWRLRFRVEDSGIGIPADRLDRLFEVFSQVDMTHSRVYGGSGLGLAICSRLIEQMGGKITVNSEPGRGSTFTFDIVAASAPDEAPRPVVRFDGVRALVVDDLAANRRIVRATLEAVGIDVTDVAHPHEALTCLRDHAFDVALLDFHMPQMTGLDLAHAIRKTPRGAALPLILLGSGTAASMSHPGLFAAQLLKPLRRATLYEQLRVVLRNGAPVGRSSTARPAAQAPRPLRILVAEDNSVNQRVAAHFLERLGHRADMVANGLEAIEAVRRQRYDVVLMDMQMPVMDGLEATSIIRRDGTPAPYIIAVTANVLPRDEQRCRDAGMQAFLTKPLSLAALDAALAQVPIAMTEAETVADADFNADGLKYVVETFDVDGARELIETMQRSLPQERDALRDAAATRDMRTAARVLHTWKGHCRLFAAAALADDLERVEHAAKREAFEELSHAIGPLVSRWAVLLETLARALPNQNAEP